MKLTAQLATHARQVYFGGNWTASSLKEALADVTWEQATAKVDSLNTIAALVFHMNYYLSIVLKVLEGGPLQGSDKYSFSLPPLLSHEDWEGLLNKTWRDAENFANLIEGLPESKLGETFCFEKYGNYVRNILGVVEHTHYHLGQIVLIKKMLLRQVNGNE